MDQDNTNQSAKARQGKASPPAMGPLTDAEAHIIRDKGTEPAFTGKYWDFFGEGVYLCRQCGSPLYKSDTKFRSQCGWPSFDDEIDGAVTRQPDADGRRTEIICAHCGGHLGHVFVGEGHTDKDTRHCVNSVSIVFRTVEEMKQAAEAVAPATVPAGRATDEAIFAGGCFWGVEHFFEDAPGVIRAESGYTGGLTKNPTYEQVCAGRTGHAEAVRVVFDPNETNYEALARLFFEIHDPTTVNRQGPDVGTQYRSAIFYKDDQQKTTAEKLIAQLAKNGYKVATEVKQATEFHQAEEHHQDYLARHPERQSCHVRTPRLWR